MRVLLTGSTTWQDAQALHREFILLPAASVIVTGDTPGIDAIAQEVAQTLGLQIEAIKNKSQTTPATHARNGKVLINVC